jgi:hypothetical protein
MVMIGDTFGTECGVSLSQWLQLAMEIFIQLLTWVDVWAFLPAYGETSLYQ